MTLKASGIDMNEDKKIPWYGYIIITFHLSMVFVLLPYGIWRSYTHDNVCTKTDVIETVEGYTTGRHSNYTIATFEGFEEVRSVKGLHKVGDEVCTRTEYLRIK